MALVWRDPFARQEIHRTMDYRGRCRWCGGNRNGRRLFKYHIETDGGRKIEIRGEFCSIGCMRSYHF